MSRSPETPVRRLTAFSVAMTLLLAACGTDVARPRLDPGGAATDDPAATQPAGDTDAAAVSAPSPFPSPAPSPSPSPRTTAAAVPASEPADEAPTVFGLAGDIGGREDRAGAVLAAAGDDGARWFGALGDLSYSEIVPESAWCDWIRSTFAAPVQVVAGNHEEDGAPDGHITRFARCLPDRMGSTPGPGGYGANYFFDDGPVRMIMLSPGLSIDGRSYEFGKGSAERRWLVDAIRGAPAWVVVGMHKVCLTMGAKDCEVGALFDLLHAEGVDMTVHGHDHNYQRTHALTCSKLNSFRADCVGDDGADDAYRRGAGTVHVIVGTVGRSLYECDHRDPERPYVEVHFCGEEGSDAKGYVLVDASSERLRVTYRNVVGRTFKDRFAIK